ncbi:MAG: DUF6089 family protein [Chitinophagaceae bacterium]
MGNQLHKPLAFLLLSFFQQQLVLAQSGYGIGGSIGAFVYQGDLAPSATGSFKTKQPGIQLFVSKPLRTAFSARINLAISRLRGNDARYDHPEYRQQRNLNFRSSLVELSGLLMWSPLRKNREERGVAPYLLAGAGISFLNIKRDWSGVNTAYFGGDGSAMVANLSADEAHRLPKTIPVVPLGAGLRYTLSPRLSVSAEATYRLVFTDYLDGFSQAANPSQNDHYHSLTASVVYSIGRKNRMDCPVIRY